MNGRDKYEELEECIKKADTTEKKIDFLTVMVCMMATNDIHHIWKLIKVLFALSIVNLIASQVDMNIVFAFLAKALA